MKNSKKEVRIDASWMKVLGDEFEKDYFRELRGFVVEEIENKRVLYPPFGQIFAAFDACAFDDVKVVILGQDPYHGAGQAHGLCFSVNEGVAVPPSLQNIYKELRDDLGISVHEHGNLEAWARQGVLLLNSTLTVRAGQPASHAGKGWEVFTDRVIREISDRKSGVVFLLWGKYAQNKGEIIDESKHHVLMAAHPSPFSAANGFFGCGHFSQANVLLEKDGGVGVDWKV